MEFPNLTTQTPAKKKEPEQLPSNPLADELKDITRNLRILEERHTNLRRKSQVIEQNMIANSKKHSQKLKDLEKNSTELKKSITKIEELLTMINSNLENCAKQQDVQVIEKYIKLWNPSIYVQRSEIPKLVNEVLKNK